jgi:hypothetical protein
MPAHCRPRADEPARFCPPPCRRANDSRRDPTLYRRPVPCPDVPPSLPTAHPRSNPLRSAPTPTTRLASSRVHPRRLTRACPFYSSQPAPDYSSHSNPPPAGDLPSALLAGPARPDFPRLVPAAQSSSRPTTQPDPVRARPTAQPSAPRSGPRHADTAPHASAANPWPHPTFHPSPGAARPRLPRTCPAEPVPAPTFQPSAMPSQPESTIHASRASSLPRADMPTQRPPQPSPTDHFRPNQDAPKPDMPDPTCAVAPRTRHADSPCHTSPTLSFTTRARLPNPSPTIPRRDFPAQPPAIRNAAPARRPKTSPPCPEPTSRSTASLASPTTQASAPSPPARARHAAPRPAIPNPSTCRVTPYPPTPARQPSSPQRHSTADYPARARASPRRSDNPTHRSNFSHGPFPAGRNPIPT